MTRQTLLSAVAVVPLFSGIASAGPTFDEYAGGNGGLWTASTSWVGGVVPGTNTQVYVRNGYWVSVDGTNAWAAGLYLGYTTNTGDGGLSNNGVLMVGTYGMSIGYAGTVGSTFNLSSGYLGISGTNGLSIGHFASSPAAVSSLYMMGGTMYSDRIVVGNSNRGMLSQTNGTITSPTLLVGNAAAGTYRMAAGSLSATNVTIGQSSQGVFQQTNGTVAVDDALTLGYGATGSGTYRISGGSLTAGHIFAGQTGTGSLQQAGGGVSALSIRLGNDKGGVGSYDLTGGTATVSSTLYVGYYPGSVGTVTHNGGTATVAGMVIGGQGVVGTYRMISGRLTSQSSISIGSSGTGWAGFQMTNGTVVCNGTMSLGPSAGYQGIAELAGGSLSSATLEIGEWDLGLFNQTGGTHTTGNMYMGWSSTTGGTYRMAAGSLTATSLEVGRWGNGLFQQTNGTVLINGPLKLGVESNGAAIGNYQIMAGSLSVDGNSPFVIGSGGSGSFTQSGGAVTAGDTILAERGVSSGTYRITAGTLTAGVTVVGSGGPAQFQQPGGTVDALALRVGEYSGASGTYDLTGGTLTLRNYGPLRIGSQGSGTFIHNGGTATMGDISIGGPGGVGNYRMVSGRLTGENMSVGASGSGMARFQMTNGTVLLNDQVSVGPSASYNGSMEISGGSFTCAEFQVGEWGWGSVSQTGGAVSATSLYLGWSSLINGSYRITAGSLTTPDLAVGMWGAASFGHTNGTVTLSHSLVVGSEESPSVVAAYRIQAGTLAAGAATTEIGAKGNGQYIQSGGSATMGQVLVGTSATGSGTFQLSAGTLTSTNTSGITIGSAGQGLYQQSGGTADFVKMSLGAGIGSGTAQVSSGMLSITSLNVGAVGSGLFQQTSGTVIVRSAMTLGMNEGTAGQMDLGGGAMFIASGATVTVGSSGNGLFSHASGTSTIRTLVLGEAAGSAGTYRLALGNLHATNITVGVQGTGRFEQTGGSAWTTLATNAGTWTMKTGSFTATGGMTNQASGDFTITSGSYWTPNTANYGAMQVNGGIVNPPTSGQSVFVNSGTMTISGGTFNQKLTNYGHLVYQGGDYRSDTINWGQLDIKAPLRLVGTSLTNYASIAVTPAGSLKVDSMAVNFGTLSVTQGATVDVLFMWNRAGATLTGNGYFVSNVTNTGTVNPAGGMLNFTALSNSPGGLITGSGYLYGTVYNAGGLIRVSGDQSLAIETLASNSAGGEIRLHDRGTLTLVTTPLTSPGSIVLDSEDCTLAGATVNNTGVLRGFGRVATPLNNSGLVRAEGGRLTFSAAATNTGRIEAEPGAAITCMQGLGNAGVIALAQGTFETGTNAMSNGLAGQILGNGTIRTGGMTNQGLLAFADATTEVYGSVNNTKDLKATGGMVTFYSPVVNASGATIKNTGATLRWLAGMTNSGGYISDPADNYFGDLAVAESGYLVGGAGDRFILTGDLESSSTNAEAWDTVLAELRFQGTGAHQLTSLAVDHGPTLAGYEDNFAWGTLAVAAGGTLDLAETDAIYVGVLELPLGPAQLQGSGEVYYNADLEANAYLGRETYALAGGGSLTPVPEPGALGLVASALLLARRRRKGR